MWPFVSGFFMFWTIIRAVACIRSSFLLSVKWHCPERPRFISNHLHRVPERIFQDDVDESLGALSGTREGMTAVSQTPLFVLLGIVLLLWAFWEF